MREPETVAARRARDYEHVAQRPPGVRVYQHPAWWCELAEIPLGRPLGLDLSRRVRAVRWCLGAGEVYFARIVADDVQACETWRRRPDHWERVTVDRLPPVVREQVCRLQRECGWRGN